MLNFKNNNNKNKFKPKNQKVDIFLDLPSYFRNSSALQDVYAHIICLVLICPQAINVQCPKKMS